MIKEIKQKLSDAWNWVKKKAKEVLIILGIVGIAMAAGTQTTILDTSPINYPLTANTDMEKLEFLYQSKEALRLEHNEMGKKFREGKITKEEWQKYKTEDFEPKSKWIGWATSVIGEKIPDVVIGTEISTSTSKVVDVKVKARQHYKEFMKKSTTWNVNLDNILKQ